MKTNKIVLGLFFLSVIIVGQIKELPQWEKGFLDIHFISTGRGSSAFYILPDGTSLVVDVGDLNVRDTQRRSTPVPNDSRTPAQWIADYIYQFHPSGKGVILDYALITHYHGDHFGHFDENAKLHPEGQYRMSGITELGSIIPIQKLVDRGYDWPIDYTNKEIQNKLRSNNGSSWVINTLKQYWKFIEFQRKINGMEYRKFDVGSSDQIVLTHYPNEFPEFKIRNLFANGDIVSQSGDSVSTRKYKEGEQPGENNLSCGIKLSYGEFDFYTGGDIPGITSTGNTDQNSMEYSVAGLIGPVDVATLNHHGNRDSQNEYFVRTIKPRVWIGQSWSSNHPGDDVLRRITSRELYFGDRDLFTNFLHEANITVIGSLARKSYMTTSGHVVIRVYPKGEVYDVFVLNDRSEEREVMNKFHYESR